MDTDSTEVECYSGSSYAQRPTALHWQGQRLAVPEVLRTWRTPGGPGFDVIVVDGRRFRLEWYEPADVWKVQEIA